MDRDHPRTQSRHAERRQIDVATDANLAAVTKLDLDQTGLRPARQTCGRFFVLGWADYGLGAASLICTGRKTGTSGETSTPSRA